MKALCILFLASAVVLTGIRQANAGPTMRLSSDNGVTWITVEDNGPSDANPTVGLVEYIGPVGDWFVNIDTGFGQPLLGSAITPTMDLGTTSQSAGPANLIVQLSDTNFIAFPNETFIAQSSGFAGGTVTYTAYRDSGDVLFGTTATSGTASVVVTQGPNSGNYQNSNGVVVPNGTGPYSLTLETVVVHTFATHSDTDSSIYALPPPPCNCTLVFNAQPSITNCADDVISDITATENCGSGPFNPPVTFAGAVTNGLCPKIIIRTNTATDDCGTVHTFVQTITVNCTPDCKISTSTNLTVVGMTNLTASVADAGPGATYTWTIVNGTITAGDGTTKITWTAGTDTNSPVTIFVTVKTAAGCQSSCNASVRLVSAPACTILGVTISNTSWNKFNIPSGTSPVVWVHMHIGGLSGIPKTGVTTLQFVGVTLTLGSNSYALPDGVMIFDSSAPSTITTSFTGGKWVTVANPNNLSDEMFFTGAAIPVTPAIAAGAKATVTYNTLASVEGISFNWQWSAAVYTFWPADWNLALIQPFHGNGLHAGTPLNTTVQKSLIQGPRGGGGSNYTGSWSATGNAACQ